MHLEIDHVAITKADTNIEHDRLVPWCVIGDLGILDFELGDRDLKTKHRFDHVAKKRLVAQEEQFEDYV